MVVAGHPVTPSREVDEAWHLHITFTHSYVERLWGEIIGRMLHHNPTKGGDAQAEKFRVQVLYWNGVGVERGRCTDVAFGGALRLLRSVFGAVTGSHLSERERTKLAPARPHAGDMYGEWYSGHCPSHQRRWQNERWS